LPFLRAAAGEALRPPGAAPDNWDRTTPPPHGAPPAPAGERHREDGLVHLLHRPSRERLRRRGGRGIVLVDALLALTVAAMLIFYGLSLMMTSSHATDAAQQTTLAYNAARQQLENVRSLRGAALAEGTYHSVRLSDGSYVLRPQLADGTLGTTSLAMIGDLPQLAELNNSTRNADGTYSVVSPGPSSVVIQPYSGAVKRLTVYIRWRSARGSAQHRSVQLTTLVAPGGVMP
jgi:type II secretory pathway pseudopilin PulG